MPTRNVNLTDHYDEFVAAEIEAGRFRNASEVMRAGLRLLEFQTREAEQKLAVLRAAAKKGFDEIDQGRGIELTSREDLAAFIAKIGERARAKAKSASPSSRRAKKGA
jgi:antitoxin ParD1/3/4